MSPFKLNLTASQASLWGLAVAALAIVVLLVALVVRPLSAEYSIPLLLNGGAKAAIWTWGAGLAWRRRRGALVAGFGLACVIVVTRALIDAQLPNASHTSLVAYAATPCASLIVASFVAMQPLRAPRPASWTL